MLYMLQLMKYKWQCIWNDQKGMGVVEVILIIIVLIGLVVVFRDNLSSLVKTLFSTMVKDANKIK